MTACESHRHHFWPGHEHLCIPLCSLPRLLARGMQGTAEGSSRAWELDPAGAWSGAEGPLVNNPRQRSAEGVSCWQGGGGHSSRSRSPQRILHVRLDFENARGGDGQEDEAMETMGGQWQRRHFACNGTKIRGCPLLVVDRGGRGLVGGRCCLPGRTFCGCGRGDEGRQG